LSFSRSQDPGDAAGAVADPPAEGAVRPVMRPAPDYGVLWIGGVTQRGSLNARHEKRGDQAVGYELPCSRRPLLGDQSRYRLLVWVGASSIAHWQRVSDLQRQVRRL
jgi:hypothetical protein